MIYAAKSNIKTYLNLTEEERAWIKHRLTFVNPDYEKALKYSPWGTPKKIAPYIYYYEETPSGRIKVPLNFSTPFKEQVISDSRVKVTLEDFPACKIKLREGQKKAFDAYSNSKDKGQILLDTGEGKTLLAYAIASHLKQKTLIIVERIAHMKAWLDDISLAFGDSITSKDIGIIRASKHTIGKYFTVATFQTLNNRDLKALSREFGLIIHDEGHHAAASTRFNIISSFYSKYRMSLTGTDKRSDGLEILHKHLYGECALNLLGKGTDIMPVDIVRVDTNYICREPKSFRRFSTMNSDGDISENVSLVDINRLRFMEASDENNVRIHLKYIMRELKKGNKCIIFTHRRFHVVRMFVYLKLLGVNCEPLFGGTPDDLKLKLVDDANAGKIDCLISTFQYIKEGQNLPEFNIGFALTTTANDIELRQAIGRIRRKTENKKVARWYDFYTTKSPTFRAHSAKRLRLWMDMKFKITHITENID